MPNANRPSGLAPVNNLLTGSYNGQARIYSIAYNYNTALYIGDPVKSSGTADANGVAGIVLAAAGTGQPIRGVIVGIGRSEGLLANPANLDRTYYPAGGDGVNTPWYALVVDDPNVIFEVQESAGTLTAADIGANVQLVSGAGNGFLSGWVIGGTSSTNAGDQIRLLGLVRRADNSFGPYAKHLVMINNHELRPGTAGV